MIDVYGCADQSSCRAREWRGVHSRVDGLEADRVEAIIGIEQAHRHRDAAIECGVGRAGVHFAHLHGNGNIAGQSRAARRTDRAVDGVVAGRLAVAVDGEDVVEARKLSFDGIGACRNRGGQQACLRRRPVCRLECAGRRPAASHALGAFDHEGARRGGQCVVLQLHQGWKQAPGQCRAVVVVSGRRKRQRCRGKQGEGQAQSSMHHQLLLTIRRTLRPNSGRP